MLRALYDGYKNQNRLSIKYITKDLRGIIVYDASAVQKHKSNIKYRKIYTNCNFSLVREEKIL